MINKDTFGLLTGDLFKHAGIVLTIKQIEQIRTTSDRLYDEILEIGKDSAKAIISELQGAIDAAFSSVEKEIEFIRSPYAEVKSENEDTNNGTSRGRD